MTGSLGHSGVTLHDTARLVCKWSHGRSLCRLILPGDTTRPSLSRRVGSLVLGSPGFSVDGTKWGASITKISREEWKDSLALSSNKRPAPSIGLARRLRIAKHVKWRRRSCGAVEEESDLNISDLQYPSRHHCTDTEKRQSRRILWYFQLKRGIHGLQLAYSSQLRSGPTIQRRGTV